MSDTEDDYVTTGSETTVATENTTAADHLDDIDVSAYILADSISVLQEHISELTARFVYYEELRTRCEAIASRCADPRTYFEEIYYCLVGPATSELTGQASGSIEHELDGTVSEKIDLA